MSKFENIFEAARKGTVEDVKVFVERDDNINAKKNKQGATPLFEAVMFNPNVEVLKYLISQGADLTAKLQVSDQSYGAIEVAGLAEAESKEKIRILREAIESEFQNAFEKVENVKRLKHAFLGLKLYEAIKGGALEEVKRIVEEGADVNAKDNGGWTSLHIAACEDSVEIVEYLVSQGADINAKEEDGFTPLHLAAGKSPGTGESRSFNVMNCLISLGADVNAKNNTGATPVDCAATCTDDEWKEISLRAHGGKSGLRGDSNSSGGCLVLFAILGASLTAGICGLASFVTGMF